MTRQTRRAADLIADDCILFRSDRGEQVRAVMSAYTVNGKTTVVLSDGEPIRVASDVPFTIATQEEVDEADAEADRKAFAAAIERFADRVVQARLPVPHRDKRIHIGLDLDRESDVQAWSRWLASNPQQGTSRLVVLAEVEGVEVMVRGPEGSTAEFGPDLADVAIRSVEHGDSVGAFPIVAPRHCAECYPGGFSPGTYEGPVRDCSVHGEKPEKAERSGWAPPSGHAAVLPPDALKHDRYNDDPRTN